MDYEAYLNCPEAQERNLRIIWSCPQCNYEYEDYPGSNEAMLCPDCHVPCMQTGESYDA